MSAPTLDAPRWPPPTHEEQLLNSTSGSSCPVSGVVLIILVLGHLLIMNILDRGV